MELEDKLREKKDVVEKLVDMLEVQYDTQKFRSIHIASLDPYKEINLESFPLLRLKEVVRELIPDYNVPVRITATTISGVVFRVEGVTLEYAYENLIKATSQKKSRWHEKVQE